MKELEASLDRCGMDHEDFRPLEVSCSLPHGPAAHCSLRPALPGLARHLNKGGEKQAP